MSHRAEAISALHAQYADSEAHTIDINAARSKDIAVCNVPSYSTEAVAQLAITFMLNFSASLSQQQAMIQNGSFTNFTACPQIPLFELQGKTLGIIGGGSIGGEVIRIAKVLGMKILVFSRRGKDWGEQDVSNAPLDELLQRSDFVSIHCPLTAETKGLVNGERLKLMKPSAFLINTARGPIIDEPALIAALKEGQIAGAALDVQDPEPPDASSPLYELGNIILTPHIGWKRLETRQRLVGLTAENITAFIQGQPINVVN